MNNYFACLFNSIVAKKNERKRKKELLSEAKRRVHRPRGQPREARAKGKGA